MGAPLFFSSFLFFSFCRAAYVSHDVRDSGGVVSPKWFHVSCVCVCVCLCLIPDLPPWLLLTKTHPSLFQQTVTKQANQMSFIIPGVVLSGILLFVVPIYIRLLYHIPYVIIGSTIPVIVLLIIGFNIRLSKFDKKEYNRTRIRKFSFAKISNWEKNLKFIEQDLDTTIDKQIYIENFIINDTLNNLTTLILRDFVESWFSKISTDPTFIVSLKHEFNHIIKNLHSKLVNVDYSNLIVHHITPLINDHIDKFLLAQEITRNTKINKSIDKLSDLQNDDDLILASNYNRGNLHSSIKLNSTTNSVNRELDFKNHLASLVDKILPSLINDSELQSAPVNILVKDLLTSCVLVPVCNMLSDPDFFNQIIVSILSKQMKDRNDVKKFRTVLRRHSMTFNNNLSSSSSSLPSSNSNDDLLRYKLSIDSSKHDYENLLNLITKSKDPKFLLKYKYYLLLRNEKLEKSNSKTQIEDSKVLQKYIKRSNTLINTINNKLNGNRRNKERDKNKSNAQNVNLDDSQFHPPMVKDLSLHEILSSPARLKYFSSFMQSRGDRYALLDFWLSAEGLRNPLEYNGNLLKQSSSTMTSTSDINVDIHTPEDDNESTDDETESMMFVDNELTQSDDIKNIFNKYFNLPVMKIPPKIYYKVSEFIEGNGSSTLSYYRARKNILKLQDFEYMRLKKTDFLAFKSSDIWLKLLVDETVDSQSPIEIVANTTNPTNSSTVPLDQLNSSEIANDQLLSNSKKVLPKEPRNDKVYGDPLANYSEKEDDGNYVDVNMTGKVSDKVVRAVEDALNEIMKDNKSEVDLSASSSNISNLTANNNGEKRNSRLVSDDIARDLFGTGDDKSLFEDDIGDSNEHSTNDYDDDVDDNKSISSTHSKVTEENVNMESSDLKVVAPSVLNLSNEIERLDVEIDRLERQRIILKALLQKAEIINNVPELRILKKSLISLEKELKFKSMQKEQYVVQEEENSLYQRTKVTIPSYITAKDKNGKTFIMYVIKVTTLSKTDPNQITANWMVTRRFSQFYELHNYLKCKYPFISTIDFPKRKLVVKFIQSSLIEERQKKLKTYLQCLVKNKEVCSDQIFRDFLSSETFDTTLDYKLQHVNEKLRNIDGSGTKLYNIISTQALYPILSLGNYKGYSESEPSLSVDDKLDEGKLEDTKLEEKMTEKLNQAKDIADDVTQFNDGDVDTDDEAMLSSTESLKVRDISFIKPICDLIISVFQLNQSTSWLRGKALILLFQQLFGSTVEKVLRANIDGKIKQEETVSKILTSLQYSLWPGGQFKKSKVPRTFIEKERTKRQTRMLLTAFLTDTTSKLFGQTAANRASDTLFFILQNEILNRHLVLSILDECLTTIFPEIKE